MKKRKSNRLQGNLRHEFFLILLLLGLLGGSSVFLSFLNSQDMKKAQETSLKIDNIDEIIANIASELANCSELMYPFSGSADYCLFRRSTTVGELGPSVRQEGFLFGDGALSFVARNDSGVNEPRPFRGVANPLLTGLGACEFKVVGPRLLRVTLKLDGSGSPGVFSRSIFLKNL